MKIVMSLSIMAGLLLIVGCVPKATSSSSSSSTTVNAGTTTNPNPTPTTTTPSGIVGCSATGIITSDEVVDFVRIKNIYGQRVGTTPYIWSSVSAPANIRSMLTTDNFLQVRVLVKANPGKIASVGCLQEILNPPYSKMDIEIGIRGSSDASYIDTAWTGNVAVGNCSQPITLLIPANSTSEPFVIDVVSAKSDQRCLWDSTNTSLSATEKQRFCPMTIHNVQQCFELEVQVATTETKKFSN